MSSKVLRTLAVELWAAGDPGSNNQYAEELEACRTAIYGALPENFPARPQFRMGARVRKKSGSAWEGRIVGIYSTALTPEGYAVESDAHPGSVQIYPVHALERT